MKLRLALLALFVTCTLVLVLVFASTPRFALADDLARRPTPTPLAPAQAEAVAPDGDTQLPDLVVNAIRVSPNPPVVNRPVTIEVDIANANHADAPLQAGNNFFVDLYINPDVPPRACLEGTVFLPVQATSLSTGQTTLRFLFVPEADDFPAVFRDVGVVRLWAQVDTAFDQANNRCGNVVESREDNNLRAAAFDLTTSTNWLQTTHQDFQTGFSSSLDLTEPSGVLQNGTGWFEEPRFPRPEENDADWPTDAAQPWDSPNFYNPDRHISADNFPDDFPREELDQWNPPDQENVDVEVGFEQQCETNEIGCQPDPDDQDDCENPEAPACAWVGYEMLFAVWEDARNGDLTDRDIYFAYSLNSGRTWLPEAGPVRVNQDATESNQLRPQLVIDRDKETLYIFWEDNRRGNYDIFFARLLDFDFRDKSATLTSADWEEPTSNPVNDFNVDANADQIKVTAATFNEPLCDENGFGCSNAEGTTHLFVAWEDYRNSNADIFSEWSSDGGDSWLKTPDSNPTTVDANIHVQPDPRSKAGAFEQRTPNLWLDRASSSGPINYCYRTELQDPNGGPPTHYYVINPLPRVFIAWDDERDIINNGDPSNIYYTRGEFNYDPAIRTASETCDEGVPQPPEAKSNLPPYRFEDDHVKVNTDVGIATQSNPAGGFTGNSFVSAPAFSDTYPLTVTIDPTTVPPTAILVTFSYTCDVRVPTEEIVINWQDNRDGNFDIWAANLFDDILVEPVYRLFPQYEANPPEYAELFDPQRAEEECENEADEQQVLTQELAPRRNADLFTPQPPEFFELALPEVNIEISDGETFTPKAQCRVPEPTGTYPSEPSQQTLPDLYVLPIFSDINQPKQNPEEAFDVTLFWNAWADTRAFGEGNQDIFLRPTLRADNSRAITVTLAVPSEADPDEFPTIELALQVVQDNVRNQITLREQDLYEDYLPANVEQSNPIIAFHTFDEDNLFEFDEQDLFYVGWDDNRNSNPFIGFEGNRDVFASRMIITDVLTTSLGFGLFPTRTATFISSVFDGGEGQEAVWYDIEWKGDITADGVVSLQTRFGLDPDQPEPPQENVAANGWTQWTGIGGTGGFYTAPGQHITGPDGERFPQSYYIQYRVNFNPLGLGQQGISCLREIKLNYEPIVYSIYLPILLRNSPASESGTVQGRVTNAATGDALGGAQVCDVASNRCTTSGFDGRYTLPSLPAGARRVRAALDGYLPLEQNVTVRAGPPVTLDFALQPSSGTVEGSVVSAVTGGPLGGAQVCRTDTPNLCATSGGDGRYTLSNVPVGAQRVRATLNGYIPLEQSVQVEGGRTVTQNFALSPILPPGEMRIVLTWGEDPSDLDSHLWLPSATPYHVFWVDQGRCDAFPNACLDVDDVSSFGPETTTLRQRSHGNYVYAIYQYTTDGALTASGARVQVYNSNGLVAEYAVPTVGDGRWWHVFDLDGATGNLTLRNTISNTSPGPYDPDPRVVTRSNKE